MCQSSGFSFSTTAGQSVQHRSPSVPEIEASILSICRRLLGNESFSATESFFDAGGNSLLAMTLVLEIERQFGFKVSLETVFSTPTVSDLCGSLDANHQPTPTVILPIRRGQLHRTLYFTHSAFEFSALSQALPSDISIDFITVNNTEWLRHVVASGDILDAIDQISDAYAQAIIARHRTGSCYLAGHSSGGIFAVEIARKLEEHGAAPDIVFLLDTYLHGSARRILHDTLYNGWLTRKIQQILEGDRRELARRGLYYIQNRFQRLIGPDKIKVRSTTVEEEFGAILQQLRESASRAYRGPRRALNSHTVLFRAIKSRAQGTMRADSNLGWAHPLRERLTIIPTPGDHFDLLRGDHANHVAREIGAQIKRPFPQV